MDISAAQGWVLIIAAGATALCSILAAAVAAVSAMRSKENSKKLDTVVVKADESKAVVEEIHTATNGTLSEVKATLQETKNSLLKSEAALLKSQEQNARLEQFIDKHFETK